MVDPKHQTAFVDFSRPSVKYLIAVGAVALATLISYFLSATKISSFLIFIISIYPLIISLRKNHPNEIYIIWFVFFFTLVVATCIWVYFDIQYFKGHGGMEHITDILTIKDDSIIVKSIQWYVETSQGVTGELVFLGLLMIIVIVPQTFSFLAAGVYGCGRQPSLISSVLNFVLLAIIKMVCALSGFIMAEHIYLYFIRKDSPFLVSDEILLSLDGYQFYVSLFLLWISFAIATCYFNTQRFGRHIYNRYFNNHAKKINRQMTRYVERVDLVDALKKKVGTEIREILDVEVSRITDIASEKIALQIRAVLNSGATRTAETLKERVASEMHKFIDAGFPDVSTAEVAYLPTGSCEAAASEHGRLRCNDGLRSVTKADSLAA